MTRKTKQVCMKCAKFHETDIKEEALVVETRFINNQVKPYKVWKAERTTCLHCGDNNLRILGVRPVLGVTGENFKEFNDLIYGMKNKPNGHVFYVHN